MSYFSSGLGAPQSSTPDIIRKLIILTCVVSLSSSLLDGLITYFFGIAGTQTWLSLNWWGFSQNFLWQPLTYLLVRPFSGGDGINFFYLIGLFFNMYILWIFGSQIVQYIGSKSFLIFYCVVGALSGIVTLLLMPLFGQYTSLAGPYAAIFGTLTFWAHLYPDNLIVLWQVFPLKGKWLAYGLIGMFLLISLSNLDMTHFSLYLLGSFFGYLYSLTFWGVHSPFTRFYRFELAVIRTSQRTQRFFQKLFGVKPQVSEESKVVDIETGEPVQDDDDTFIDDMLEKIAKDGEGSLSWWERRRMRKISERKSREP